MCVCVCWRDGGPRKSNQRKDSRNFWRNLIADFSDWCWSEIRQRAAPLFLRLETWPENDFKWIKNEQVRIMMTEWRRAHSFVVQGRGGGKLLKGREGWAHERKLRGHSNCQPKIQFIVWMCRRALMSFFFPLDGCLNGCVCRERVDKHLRWSIQEIPLTSS